MDFDFSEEQNQLREAVSRWVERAYTTERRKDILSQGGFSPQASQEMAALGLYALTVDNRYDGLGYGAVEAMVTMEALGQGLVLEPLVPTLMVTALIQADAPASMQEEVLPGVASGQRLVTLAYQERGARYLLNRCGTQATLGASGYVLSGTKHLVSLCDQAHTFVVPALLDGQMALFLVQADAPHLQRSGYQTQDGSRAGDLLLDNTPGTLISRQGQALLELALDVGIAAVCAQGVGIMDRALSLTVEYMKTRQQFGAPIASFQALRHRVADMKMQVELARAMSYYATLKLEAPADERRQATSRAKYQLGQSMRFVGQQAVQLHGGIGVTQEAIISHCFKTLTQLEMTFGDSLHHLGEVSERMQASAGVFS